MNNEQYIEMLAVFNKYFKPMIIQWPNGLKVKCKSFTGIMENDLEPDEADYVGEYSAGVNEVEILEQGSDDSVEIYDDSIEICLKCIPEIISKEDGTVLWRRNE